MLLPVGLLSTRVTKSIQQDQKKLKRVLDYIKGSFDLVYTMRVDSLSKIKSWVDVAFAIHLDLMSHTGGTTSFGLGGYMASHKNKN